MTAAELKFSFDEKLKSLTDVKEVLFETVDVNKLLAEAEVNFIRMAYQSFDRTELERKLLANLITTFSTTTFIRDNALMGSNSWAVTLPSDMMYVLEEHIFNSSATRIPIKPITYDRFLIDINNPFKMPYSELAWRLDYGGTSGYSGASDYGRYYHEIITDGTTPTSYRARYVRNPIPIDIDNDVTSEIHPNYHTEIVNGAVKLALGIISLRTALQKSQQQPEANNDNQSKQ